MKPNNNDTLTLQQLDQALSEAIRALEKIYLDGTNETPERIKAASAVSTLANAHIKVKAAARDESEKKPITDWINNNPLRRVK